MRRILCYGDSNTYGFDPETGRRHDERHRWTMLLAGSLGEGWRVIEEGLSGRNSGLDDPLSPIRNGRTFLPVALSSHRPLDLVVLMLGSNDFKTYFHQTADMVAVRIIALARIITTYDYGPYPAPKVLVLAPVVMGKAALETGKFDERSLAESARLPKVLGQECGRCGMSFLDCSALVHPGRDGQHLDETNQRILSEVLTLQVKHFFAK